jgi:hypothetical protein
MDQRPLNFNRNHDEGMTQRDAGIARAVDHAESETENWTDTARRFLSLYMQAHRGTFMAEDMRAWAVENGCPEPPSLRAWGGVIAGAAKSGMIEQVGHSQVKNPNAHCANAALWKQAA